MSATHSVQSIPDTQIGLTQGEIQILRQQQQVMAQRSHQDSRADRGRGTSRHSQPSSRAASAASSQAGHRIILDPQHLRALQTHLDNVLRAIENRIVELEEATESSTSTRSEKHRRTEAEAEREIQRVRNIIAQIDRLEEEFEKIQRIKEAVKRLKKRVDDVGERMDRTSAARPTDARHGERNGDRTSASRHADLAYRPRERDRHR